MDVELPLDRVTKWVGARLPGAGASFSAQREQDVGDAHRLTDALRGKLCARAREAGANPLRDAVDRQLHFHLGLLVSVTE